jgi:hypothetical protein
VPVSRDLFRAISGSFPAGVLIVATLDKKGEPKGLTTQAYMGVSTEPPLMDYTRTYAAWPVERPAPPVAGTD